jgi:hypothetical protein
MLSRELVNVYVRRTSIGFHLGFEAEIFCFPIGRAEFVGRKASGVGGISCLWIVWGELSTDHIPKLVDTAYSPDAIPFSVESDFGEFMQFCSECQSFFDFYPLQLNVASRLPRLRRNPTCLVGEGYKTLSNGDEVHFEVEQGARGPQASKVKKV